MFWFKLTSKVAVRIKVFLKILHGKSFKRRTSYRPIEVERGNVDIQYKRAIHVEWRLYLNRSKALYGDLIGYEMATFVPGRQRVCLRCRGIASG